MNQVTRNREEELEQREKAGKLWHESERILNILRTESAKPLKDVTKEEILLWHKNNLNP
jgi:hypothetical protein